MNCIKNKILYNTLPIIVKIAKDIY